MPSEKHTKRVTAQIRKLISWQELTSRYPHLLEIKVYINLSEVVSILLSLTAAVFVEAVKADTQAAAATLWVGIQIP